MKLGTLWIALALGSVLVSGCSRAKIDAVELANEASLLRKQGALDAAIDKYETASQLDPTNHQILYMLAQTYAKKEEWERTASTLARATQVAPKFANYWYERGYALAQVADKSKSQSAFEEAKQPLEKCIEADPNYAQCYFQLGYVELWLDHEQEALDNYTKAIQHLPTMTTFYAPLADLYLRLGYTDHAEKVLQQGIELGEDRGKAKFNLYVLLSQVEQTKDNMPGMVAALEKANEIGGKDNPEILFNLGSTYAVMNPPKKTQAVQMLKQFQARACKGGQSEKYREQCEQSMALVGKLSGAI